MDTTLRIAQPADHATLAGWLPDAEATWQWAGPGVRHPFKAYEWDRLLDEAEGRSYLMLHGDEAVAFGQCLLSRSDELHLRHLLVRPDRRRQGCGRALCARLIELAMAESEVRAITLEVAHQDIAARNLFSQFGFQGRPAAPDAPLLGLRLMLRRTAA